MTFIIGNENRRIRKFEVFFRPEVKKYQKNMISINRDEIGIISDHHRFFEKKDMISKIMIKFPLIGNKNTSGYINLTPISDRLENAKCI